MILPVGEGDRLEKAFETIAGMEPWLGLGISAQTLLAAHQNDPKREAWFRVDETDSVPLGLISFRRKDASEALVRVGFPREAVFSEEAEGYVHLLAVFPGCQGRGVGRELLEWAEACCREAGSDGILLCVSLRNRPAADFYKKQGFRKVMRLDNCIVPGNTEILMRKAFGLEDV